MRTSFGRAAIALIPMLSACGPNPQVEARKQFWAHETELFFETHRTLPDLHAWLRQHNVYYTFDETDVVDGHWTVGLEKVYLETPGCEWVDIRLQVSVDAFQRVQGYSLNEAAQCLW